MKRIISIVIALVLANACVAEPVKVQILAINDFHGALEPPAGSTGKIDGIDAGGAEYLATHLRNMQNGHEHSIVVSAGDLFGASPLLSAMFKEEPTIKAMNRMGLAINAVGNHEFDKGWRELLRVANGDDNFSGAKFSFLAANVVVNETGKTLFPAYDIREFSGVKIAFVGVVVHKIDLLVAATAIEGLSFLPEAETVNALIPELTAQGVNTVVVIIHEGGFPTGGFNECPGISGPIVDIAQKMHDNVAVVLSGHTHQAYNCQIGNKLVTSGASNGRLVTDVELTFGGEKKAMLSVRADNVIVTRNVEKDAQQSAIIAKYREKAIPVANRIIGRITEELSKGINSAGESALGRMIADAQLASTIISPSTTAEISLINPGGIRTDITYPSSTEGEGDGNVTFAEAFAVQPFGNRLITMSMTGAQLVEALEQQFPSCNGDKTRIMQISKSLHYAYRDQGHACENIDRKTITINGTALDMDRSYRVVVNSFLADGGDGFSAFKKGSDKIAGSLDIEALQNYLETRSPITPDNVARISKLN